MQLLLGKVTATQRSPTRRNDGLTIGSKSERLKTRRKSVTILYGHWQIFSTFSMRKCETRPKKGIRRAATTGALYNLHPRWILSGTPTFDRSPLGQLIFREESAGPRPNTDKLLLLRTLENVSKHRQTEHTTRQWKSSSDIRRTIEDDKRTGGLKSRGARTGRTSRLSPRKLSLFSRNSVRGSPKSIRSALGPKQIGLSPPEEKSDKRRKRRGKATNMQRCASRSFRVNW